MELLEPQDSRKLVRMKTLIPSTKVCRKNNCSGVGMLLYLIKYSRPDLSNAVRELSKCMDKATMGTYQEMLCVIKFVLDTKHF
jgi:hypothetical protein